MRMTFAICLCAIAGGLLSTQQAQSQDKYVNAKKAFAQQMVQSQKRSLNDPLKARYDDQAKTEGGGWQKKVISGKEIDVWVGKPARVEPADPIQGCLPGTNNQPMPVQTCVRVWAELSNPEGAQTGKFVNIELYKWRPNQHLYFWLDSPVPVQLSMVQYYDVGAAEGKDAKLVSPNAKFPLTYSTVVPGQAFRFPQLFKMDNKLNDEFVTLTVIRAGEAVPSSPGTPPAVCPINVPNDPTGGGTVNNVQITQQNNMMNFLSGSGILIRKDKSIAYSNKDAELRRMEAVSPGLPVNVPAGTTPEIYVSGDYNTVALFALGSQTIGHLPLRFHK